MNKVLDAQALIRLQIELEYQVDAQGNLYPFPGSSEQSTYIIYRYMKDGWLSQRMLAQHMQKLNAEYVHIQFVHHMLPPELRRQLLARPPEATMQGEPELLQLLDQWQAPHKAGFFRNGALLRRPEAQEFSQVQAGEGYFYIAVDGDPVASAWSERQNDNCAEIAVETNPGFRHRGYARQVVAALVDSLQRSGRVALYSHAAHNLESQALARSLGVVYYALCTSYEVEHE